MLSGLGNIIKGLQKTIPPTAQHGGQGRRVLRKGVSGMDVARCQNLLNREMAFSPPPLWVDGIFGPITDRKCRAFQMKKGLLVDGIVGPATWSALEGKPVAVGGGGYDKPYGPGFDKGQGGGGGFSKNPIGDLVSGIGKGIGKGLGGNLGKVMK